MARYVHRMGSHDLLISGVGEQERTCCVIN